MRRDLFALIVAGVIALAAALGAPNAKSATVQAQGQVVATCDTGSPTPIDNGFVYLTTDAHGALCLNGTFSATVNVAPVTTTETGGTVTTHGTFQAALASAGGRKGCTVQNTSADVEYVFFGATVSATTTNSFQLAAGQSINCAVGGLSVATDNIAISSKTTDGAAFVVSSQ